MTKSNVFRVFPNAPIPPFAKRAKGLNIWTNAGEKLLDATAGGTSYAILGWNHPRINEAIKKQLSRYTHLDYKIWSDENTEMLADILLSKAEHDLNKVYFSGNSGAEACEAAMKMSYQAHYDKGNLEKKWFISRKQSYHGATSDALALGERPNLEFYRAMLSPYRAQIEMHHPLYCKKSDESDDEYAKRSARELEQKILEIGPENVAGFVGETIMGGLVGDVPPCVNYWKYMKKVCTKYDVHLILDEIYCGTGTTGKIYCCDWDGVTPDFILIGKTLAAGYGALSAVITSSEIEETIAKGQGRLQHTTTHQALSIGVAAALEVQKIIHADGFLENVQKIGSFMRNQLKTELGHLQEFRDLRGRGLRFSLEHSTSDNSSFASILQAKLREKHNILIDSKWHRTCFTPALNISRAEAEQIMECFISEFKKASLNQ